MVRSSKRLALVVGIIIAGSSITAYTNYYITKQQSKYRQMAVPQEEAKTAAFAGGIAIINETGTAMAVLGENSETEEKETASEESGLSRSLNTPSLKEAEAAVSPQAADTEESVLSQQKILPEAGVRAAGFTAPVADAQTNVLSAGLAEEKNLAAADEEESVYSQSKSRLDELDIQIQKMRDAQVDSTAYSIKALADTELKLWDRELSNVYIQIMDQLDEEEQVNLAKDQREWMNQRDVQAESAAPRNKSGSVESAGYTASLAASTRQRAYDLLERYQTYLK